MNMGMSTHIVGFRPPDEKWKAMKKIYDACVAAKEGMPSEVDSFFNDIPPDPAGVQIGLEDYPGTKVKIGAVKLWKDESGEVFEVDITKLPKDVTHRTITR